MGFTTQRILGELWSLFDVFDRWMRRETSMQFVGFAQETIPLIMIEVSKDPQLGTDHQQEEVSVQAFNHQFQRT